MSTRLDTPRAIGTPAQGAGISAGGFKADVVGMDLGHIEASSECADSVGP